MPSPDVKPCPYENKDMSCHYPFSGWSDYCWGYATCVDESKSKEDIIKMCESNGGCEFYRRQTIDKEAKDGR